MNIVILTISWERLGLKVQLKKVCKVECFGYYICINYLATDILDHIVIAHPRAKNLIESLNEIKNHDFRPELGYKVKVEMPDEVRSDIQESNNRVKCKDCGKRFYPMSKLKLHIRSIHEGIKDYNCDFCESEFSVFNDLKNHIARVHIGIKA